MYEGLSRGIASPTPSVDSVDDLEDDLAIFGGQMRVLDRKSKNPHQRSPSMSSTSGSGSGSSPQTPSSNTTNLSPTSPSGGGMLGLGLGLPDVHPSLITYLNQDAVRRAVPQQQQQLGGDTVGSMVPVSSSDTAYEGPYERSHLVSGRSVSQFLLFISVGSWLLKWLLHSIRLIRRLRGTPLPRVPSRRVGAPRLSRDLTL